MSHVRSNHRLLASTYMTSNTIRSASKAPGQESCFITPNLTDPSSQGKCCSLFCDVARVDETCQGKVDELWCLKDDTRRCVHSVWRSSSLTCLLVRSVYISVAECM